MEWGISLFLSTGPNTVAFLQSKRQHRGGPKEEEEEEGVRLAGSAGPLHMQREESEKLEWMTDTATPSLVSVCVCVAAAGV